MSLPLQTMRGQLARAVAVRGWPGAAQAESARLASLAEDREDLLALADWHAAQPYPGAGAIAGIARTAAGAGRYAETPGSLVGGAVQGALEDVTGAVRGAGSVAAAGAQGARRLFSSPPLLVALLAAAGGLVYALRR